MKKIFFAFALIVVASATLASCKGKEKCDAYSSSTSAHHKTVRN